MENTTGITEDYKAMVDSLEKEKRGLYSDYKAEKEKRQALEERVAQIERSRTASSPTQDENLQWINEFAQKPKDVLRREFDEYARPLRETNSQMVRTLAQREALDWLSEQENVPATKIRKGEILKDLERIAKENGLESMPLLAGTQAAYQIRQLELKRKEESEKDRAAAIQAASTEAPSKPLSSGSPGRTWRESEIAAMDLPTFQHYSKDITLAKSEGRVVLDLSRPNEKGRLEIPRG